MQADDIGMLDRRQDVNLHHEVVELLVRLEHADLGGGVQFLVMHGGVPSPHLVDLAKGAIPQIPHDLPPALGVLVHADVAQIGLLLLGLARPQTQHLLQIAEEGHLLHHTMSPFTHGLLSHSIFFPPPSSIVLKEKRQDNE